MRNRWSDREAGAFVEQLGERWGEALALRTYSSRLLGAEPALVLHGGGNTSVKGSWRTVLGHQAPAVFVKASGFDMATIAPEGHPPLDLDALRELRTLASLDDDAMVNEVRRALFDTRSPNPSIETLLHAFLPAVFIDHSHADAILALTNQHGGRDLVAEALGDEVVTLDYVEPGFRLARAAADAIENAPEARGLVLMHHGLLTWGATARESYDAHVELATRAENITARRAAKGPSVTAPEAAVAGARARFGELAPVIRGQLARPTGQSDRSWDPVVLAHRCDRELLGWLETDAGRQSFLTPALTTDHLIRTKSMPAWVERPNLADPDMFREQLRRTIFDFTQAYQAYLDRHRSMMPSGISTFDPYPRVLLVPGLGAVCAGPDAAAARVAADIASQTLRVKASIARMGGVYEGLPEAHLFPMEYRGLQHAKLERPGGSLRGRVALITGAAGAIGAGIAQGLLEQGCHVAVTDLAGPRLTALGDELAAAFPDRVTSVALDVTDPASAEAAFVETCRAWGGVDLVVINAGLAHVQPLTTMNLEKFRLLERVNIDGTLIVIGEAGRHFSRQRTGGDIVLVSTKNVFAPGAHFGAYSATKAASHQLARIASLELAELDVRVNMVSPDAVFSHGPWKSGLWAEVGPGRMKARGLDEAGLEEYYRSRNLLKARVTAKHVANAVLFFATRQSPTTGSTIPVDGGLPDATPR
ncbi:MAG: bifunctional aldolase/short-chain dehydrogenase [Acidobacteriota bacterium]